MYNNLGLKVNGHVLITDDAGTVLLDKDNAVHPQNLSRIIARGLAHEDNYYIYRIAYGNGGTIVDASEHITYNTPNDGQDPDVNTWNSALYNETYSEIVDDQSNSLGEGPGAVPEDDPVSIPNVSGPGVRSVEAGLVSRVVIESVLNASEPTSQYLTDIVGTPGFPESDFTFDEIGLFTTGLPLAAVRGYQDVDVSTKNIVDETGLLTNTTYTFTIQVNGGASNAVNVVTPTVGSGIGGVILYGDLTALIEPLISGYGASVDISGGEAATYGFLRFYSILTGSTSTITLTNNGVNPLFSALSGYVSILPAVNGRNSGVANAPTASNTEAERMLTHIIFAPILKSANRTLTIKYTLTISVARTEPPNIL